MLLDINPVDSVTRHSLFFSYLFQEKDVQTYLQQKIKTKHKKTQCILKHLMAPDSFNILYIFKCMYTLERYFRRLEKKIQNCNTEKRARATWLHKVFTVSHWETFLHSEKLFKWRDTTGFDPVCLHCQSKEGGSSTSSYNQIWLGYWKQDRLLLCLKIEKIDWKILSLSGVSEWTWQNVEGNGHGGTVPALLKEEPSRLSEASTTRRQRMSKTEENRKDPYIWLKLPELSFSGLSKGQRWRVAAHFRPTTSCSHRPLGTTTSTRTKQHMWNYTSRAQVTP